MNYSSESAPFTEPSYPPLIPILGYLIDQSRHHVLSPLIQEHLRIPLFPQAPTDQDDQRIKTSPVLLAYSFSHCQPPEVYGVILLRYANMHLQLLETPATLAWRRHISSEYGSDHWFPVGR
jgi:hypothetical protein